MRTNVIILEKMSIKGRIMAKKKKSIIFWCVTAGIIALLLIFKIQYVKTGSMEPSLETGDLVVINPFVKDLKNGDIAVYEWNGIEVCHRVVSAGKEGYRFQGDANGTEDPVVVNREEVVGKVMFRIHFLAPVVRAVERL
jgi:signal peptidase